MVHERSSANRMSAFYFYRRSTSSDSRSSFCTARASLRISCRSEMVRIVHPRPALRIAPSLAGRRTSRRVSLAEKSSGQGPHKTPESARPLMLCAVRGHACAPLPATCSLYFIPSLFASLLSSGCRRGGGYSALRRRSRSHLPCFWICS